MRNNRVQKMVSIAMLAAMGVVLQFVAFPVLPAVPFMKVDFSDIPIMIGMFLFGPMAGIATAFIRSTIHLVMSGFSLDNLVGDAASFLATTIFTMPMYYFFRQSGHALVKKVIGVFSGIVLMTIFMSVANYFVITPVYLYLLGVTVDQFLGMSLGSYVLVSVIPFNLIKGGIVSAIFLVLHAKLLPWLQRQQNKAMSHHKPTI